MLLNRASELKKMHGQLAMFCIFELKLSETCFKTGLRNPLNFTLSSDLWDRRSRGI